MLAPGLEASLPPVKGGGLWVPPPRSLSAAHLGWGQRLRYERFDLASTCASGSVGLYGSYTVTGWPVSFSAKAFRRGPSFLSAGTGTPLRNTRVNVVCTTVSCFDRSSSSSRCCLYSSS